MNLFSMFTHVSISRHYCCYCNWALLGKKLFSSLNRWLELRPLCKWLFPACIGSSDSGFPVCWWHMTFILFLHTLCKNWFWEVLNFLHFGGSQEPLCKQTNKQTNKDLLKNLGPSKGECSCPGRIHASEKPVVVPFWTIIWLLAEATWYLDGRA